MLLPLPLSWPGSSSKDTAALHACVPASTGIQPCLNTLCKQTITRNCSEVRAAVFAHPGPCSGTWSLTGPRQRLTGLQGHKLGTPTVCWGHEAVTQRGCWGQGEGRGKKPHNRNKVLLGTVREQQGWQPSPRCAEWVTREGGQPFPHGFRHVTHLIARTTLLSVTTLCTFVLFAGADLLQGTALPGSLIRQNQGLGHVRWRLTAGATAAVHTGYTTSLGPARFWPAPCLMPRVGRGAQLSKPKLQTVPMTQCFQQPRAFCQVHLLALLCPCYYLLFNSVIILANPGTVSQDTACLEGKVPPN